jgi:hypothetical protein
MYDLKKTFQKPQISKKAPFQNPVYKDANLMLYIKPMKNLFVLTLLIAKTLSQIKEEGCIFGRNIARMDSHIYEMGISTKRVFDGYVTKVLTKLPPRNEFGVFDYTGIEWDPAQTPVSPTIVLVLVPGSSPLAGKRYSKCLKTTDKEHAIVRITNFNSSKPECVEELRMIQENKKRVIATMCGVYKTHSTGYTFSTMDNDKRPLPMIFSYEDTTSDNYLADYTITLISKMREFYKADDKLTCSFGPSKCDCWLNGTHPFTVLDFSSIDIQKQYTSCVDDSNLDYCNYMAVPELGLNMPPSQYQVDAQCCYFGIGQPTN